MPRNDDFMRHFLSHEGDIRAFIGSLVLDRHVRDDVFQEAALTLWQQFDAYDPARSFGAWARGIAAKKILQRRDQDRRFPLAFSPQTIQAVLDAFNRTESEASRKADALHECIKLLPDHAREMLTLRYQQNMKPPEIAERSGRTLDAIYQVLSRLRAKLEECIRQHIQPQAGDA